MWANLLNILSRSGVGSCLTPQDTRDEANNFVMGLLFLSGDWWEGSGGPGPGPRRRGRMERQGQAAVREPTQASSVQFSALPTFRRAASDQSPAARSWPLMLPAAASFLPSVKFPVASVGFHVQHTCVPRDPGATPGSKAWALCVPCLRVLLSGKLLLGSGSCS